MVPPCQWLHCPHLSRMGRHWSSCALSSQCPLEAVEAEARPPLSPGSCCCTWLAAYSPCFQFPQGPQGDILCPVWAEMGKSPEHASPSHPLRFGLSRKRQGKRTSQREGHRLRYPKTHSSFRDENVYLQDFPYYLLFLNYFFFNVLRRIMINS